MENSLQTWVSWNPESQTIFHKLNLYLFIIII